MTAVAPAPARAPVPRPQPQPKPRHRPPLRVVTVDERRRPVDRRRRARRFTSLAVLLAVAGLFGLVASHVVLTQGQFELEQLQTKAADEQARFQRLRRQVAELESPERIVAAAQERLGMVAPPGVQYLAPVGGAAGGAEAAADEPADDLAAGGDWSTVKRHLASRP